MKNKLFTPRRDENLFLLLFFYILIFFSLFHKKGTINFLRVTRSTSYTEEKLFFLFFFSFIFREDEAIIKDEEKKNTTRITEEVSSFDGYFFLIYNVFLASTPKKKCLKSESLSMFDIWFTISSSSSSFLFSTVAHIFNCTS